MLLNTLKSFIRALCPVYPCSSPRVETDTELSLDTHPVTFISELKKRQKLREKEAKLKAKEEEKAKTQEDKAVNVEELDPSKYTENRKQWI